MTQEEKNPDSSQSQPSAIGPIGAVGPLGPPSVPTPDADAIKRLKIKFEASIYLVVIAFLGIIVLSVIIVVGYIVLSPVPAGGTAKPIPEGLIAIGSAAVGAMAGILAPSPANKA